MKNQNEISAFSREDITLMAEVELVSELEGIINEKLHSLSRHFPRQVIEDIVDLTIATYKYNETETCKWRSIKERNNEKQNF